MATQTGSIDLTASNDAAKTATNYIGIDSTGIRIANANPSTATTYQHQSATSTEFVVDGSSMAEISGDGARFGVSAEPHLELSSSRMILTELNDSLNSRPRFDVDATDTYYSNPFDIPSSAISTGLTVKIAGGFVKVTPAALSIGDSSRTDERDATLLAGTSMVRVGKAGDSHVVVSQDAITMLDSNGNVFMDVRDNGLYQTRTYTLTANGSHQAVFPDPQPMLIKDSETDVTITVDGVPYEYGVDVTFDKNINGDVVKLYDVWFIDSVPAAGSTIVVTFKTESDKTYTLGKRTDGTTEGPYSLVEGYNNEASGYMSHAEGGECSATDLYTHAEGAGCAASHPYAHAEGWNTTSSGNAAHSEGLRTVASGAMSHAQNAQTIAASNYQTALGHYNVADANSTYAVIVGNGTNDSHRSNALTVDWDGVVDCGGIAPKWVTVASTDFFDSINNGWSNDSTYTQLAYSPTLRRVVGRIKLQSTATHSAGNNVIGTVAESYRPYIRALCMSTTTNPYRLYIDASGTMTMALATATTTTTVDFYLAADYTVA